MKIPAVSGWQEDEEILGNDQDIKVWIKDGYNVGLPAGYNDLFIIDIDKKKNVDGFKSLEAFGIILPPTLTQDTPSGGKHYIYKINDFDLSFLGESRGGNAGIIDGIDYRYRNSYIVVEPSKIDGKPYKLSANLDYKNITRLDDRLRDFFTLIKMKKAKANINKLLETKIAQGSRNNDLTSIGGYYQEMGESDDLIKDILLFKNNMLDEPLLESEVLSIVKSVTSYKKGNKRHVELKNGKDITKYLKFNKKGVPTDIHDKNIVDDIIKNHNFLNIGGNFYFYFNGVYTNTFKYDDTYINGQQYMYKLIESMIPNNLIKSTTRKRVLNMIQENTLLNNDQINKYINNHDDNLVNFKNGMFNLLTGKLEPHDPQYNSINQIPYGLDINQIKKANLRDSKVIYKFLNEMIIDKDSIRMLIDYISLSLTIKQPQQFMYLVGKGGIGKSVLIRLIKSIVGEINSSNISLQGLSERFQNAGIFGKTLNLFPDLSAKAIMSGESLKTIFGGDEITVEQKYQPSFRFYPYVKSIFSMNRIPDYIDEKSNAYYRRLLIVKCKAKASYIENIDESLKDDIPILLPYLVKRLMELKKTDFVVEESNESKEEKQKLERVTNPLKAFIDDCLIYTDDDTSYIYKSSIYKFYKDYCELNGYRVLGNQKFFVELESLGFNFIKLKGYPILRSYNLTPSEGQNISIRSEKMDGQFKDRSFGQVIDIEPGFRIDKIKTENLLFFTNV